MRFLFDLFSNDPSKNWTKSGEPRLTFHMAAQSLNGAAIEDPFDKLSVFGRPANREPFEKNLFDYPDLGLEIGGENSRIKYFSFAIQSFSGNSKSCEVTLITERGTQILLDKNTRSGDLEGVLGKPVGQEKSVADEAEYRYKYKRLILAFEFDEDRLASFEAGLEDYV